MKLVYVSYPKCYAARDGRVMSEFPTDEQQHQRHAVLLGCAWSDRSMEDLIKESVVGHGGSIPTEMIQYHTVETEDLLARIVVTPGP